MPWHLPRSNIHRKPRGTTFRWQWSCQGKLDCTSNAWEWHWAVYRAPPLFALGRPPSAAPSWKGAQSLAVLVLLGMLVQHALIQSARLTWLKVLTGMAASSDSIQNHRESGEWKALWRSRISISIPLYTTSRLKRSRTNAKAYMSPLPRFIIHRAPRFFLWARGNFNSIPRSDIKCFLWLSLRKVMLTVYRRGPSMHL